jgi:hypothetical protein
VSSFCELPFLLTTEAKSNILRVSAHASAALVDDQTAGCREAPVSVVILVVWDQACYKACACTAVHVVSRRLVLIFKLVAVAAHSQPTPCHSTHPL